MARFLLLSFPALLCIADVATLGYPASAFAQQTSLEGRIQGFECGDNCYLTIVDDAHREHTGLCAASACKPWNENVEMPSRYAGSRVVVTLGQGVQTDAEGNVMGKITAFRKIRFLDRP